MTSHMFGAVSMTKFKDFRLPKETETKENPDEVVKNSLRKYEEFSNFETYRRRVFTCW